MTQFPKLSLGEFEMLENLAKIMALSDRHFRLVLSWTRKVRPIQQHIPPTNPFTTTLLTHPPQRPWKGVPSSRGDQ